MSWQAWADALRRDPQQAVGDLLRGAADVGPFERAAPHEMLLAILPRAARLRTQALLGEPRSSAPPPEQCADLPALLDTGLRDWLLAQRASAMPPARKLSAYAAQLCEALQWPLYFPLPQTRAALRDERVRWLQWLSSLTLSAFRDPEHDYWQVLAAQQPDDDLQVFWHAFVAEAGRTRSARYLDLGLLALARLPLREDDSLRNLRLQVQALVHRYRQRRAWGTSAHEELAQSLRGVMARNPSLSATNYKAFLQDLLAPLGEDRVVSVLSLLGLMHVREVHQVATVPVDGYRLEPPGQANDTDQAVRAVRNSQGLHQAWDAIRPLLDAHEAFVHRTGDAYYFVRTLDKCARALCNRYSIADAQIQGRLFQWIQLALQMDADNPRIWLLWELALRKTGHPRRAQWVLWEMTRRFPDHLPCRVELARLLATSDAPREQAQAQRLLRQVLRLDPEHLHAHSTLAQLAIRKGDWAGALDHAHRGLQIAPDHEASAVLLASAYARRREPGDLDAAIEHLERFTTRYPGQLKAEDYLRKLLHRRSTAQAQFVDQDDAEPPTRTEAAAPETDPAWRAFAESLRTWAAGREPSSPRSDDPLAIDRVLPLPTALRQALDRDQWDEETLAHYDAAAQREFPLETRLWRYLQTLHADTASEADQDRAKQAVEHWLQAEQRAPSYDSPTWLQFLMTSWQALTDPAEASLEAGRDWLKDLLDRYHPLPAPLYA